MTSTLSHRASRVLGVMGLILILLCIFRPQPAQSQIWRMRVSVVTPIPEKGPLHAFLDTLTQTIQREDIQIRRAPNKQERFSFAELDDFLIDQYGLSISGANVVFLDYKFERQSGTELQQNLTGLQFVYRSEIENEDIPVFYLNPQEQWVQKILRQQGTNLPTNESALIPFERSLALSLLAHFPDTDIVSIGNRTIRTDFDVEKRVFLQRLYDLAYGL